MTRFALASLTLLQREMWRFLRQPSRIAGAVGTPLLFWLFIGAGFSGSFDFPINYLQYFYPGTIVLVLFFTSIFSTIVIIDDRNHGFLQGVLVSPAPRSALVLGHLLGGTALATLQSLLFLALAPLLGITFGPVGFLYILTVVIFMSFGLTGLGFTIAWKMDSISGYHAFMNLFLMPLWLLSGSVFPLDNAPGWLAVIMKFNPLTYSVAALHHGFYKEASAFQQTLPSATVCLLATILFGLLMFAAALWTSRKSSS